jgi:hypothetical protein
MSLINLVSEWEYQSTANVVPVDINLVTVPAAGWTLGEAPFGEGVPPLGLTTPETVWTRDTGLWIRRFVICEGEKDIVVKGNCEQAMFMFWNGIYVGTLNPTNTNRGDVPEYRVIIPRELATDTTHEIALLCLDDNSVSPGAISYISVEADYLPVLFPFQPEAPVKENLSWLTDVIISRDGTEDRKRISTSPRQEFYYNYPTGFDKKIKAQNIIWGDIGSEILVPIWTQAVRVNSIAAGVTTINLETRYSEFRYPGYAIIWSSDSNWQLVGIYDITDTQFKINNVARAYSRCWIMPVRIGVLTKGATRSFDGLSANFDLQFMIRDNQEITVNAPAQYLGEDVYLQETLLFGDSLAEDIKIDLEIFDPGIGEFALYTGLSRAKSLRSFNVVCEGMIVSWALRQFLNRRSGRYRTFRQPTFENDLRVTNTGNITTLLQVFKDEYMRSSQSRDVIAIETNSGWLLRQILDVVSIDQTRMSLQLDTAINITKDQIRRVCWLGLRRLDTDNIEINHQGAGYSTSSFTMVEIDS